MLPGRKQSLETGWLGRFGNSRSVIGNGAVGDDQTEGLEQAEDCRSMHNEAYSIDGI